MPNAARWRSRWHRSVGLAAFLAVMGGGCGQSGSGGSSSDGWLEDARYDRKAMLLDLASEVVRPEVAGFRQDAAALAAAVSAWRKAGAAADGRDAARSAWQAAWQRWQRLELFQFGPAAMDSHALRDRIYGWPVVSACAVDQGAATCDPTAACDAAAALPNRKGLDALEFLLFRDSAEHECPGPAAPKDWAGWSEVERWQRRAAWADAVAVDLVAAADALDQAWRADGGDYVAVLEQAGASGSSFPSLREAINHFTDALFYLDTETKTMKVGQPAGIAGNACGIFGEPCLLALESRWAGANKVAILANLEAFATVVKGRPLAAGGRGPGIAAWLRAIDAAALADTLESQIDAAIAAVTAIPGELDEALQGAADGAGRKAVQAAYDALVELMRTMKTQLLTTLGLDLPDAAAADAD